MMTTETECIDQSHLNWRKTDVNASETGLVSKRDAVDEHSGFQEQRDQISEEREGTDHRSPSLENNQTEQREPGGYSLWSWINPSPVGETVKESKSNRKKESFRPLPWSSLFNWKNSSDEKSGQTIHGETRTSVPEDDESLASTRYGGSTKLLGDLHSLPSLAGDESVAGGRSYAGSEIIETGSRGDDTVIERAVVSLKLNEVNDGSKLTSVDGIDGDMALNHRRTVLVKELRDAVSSNGRYDVKCANISVALGDLLLESGQHEQAIKLHKDAVMIYSCKLGDDHITTLDAKIRLGNVYEEADHVGEAINMYYSATSMKRSLMGDDDPSIADGYVLLSQALRKKKDYTQAIKELKRALKIYRGALGDSHEKVTKTVDEIASLHVTIGDFEKSAAILEEVVKLRAATYGVSHSSVAVSLCNLATTYECSSKFDKAMKTLKKAYKIYTEIGGYSSEDSTLVLHRMAQLYEATNDNHRAAIAYLGVLRGRKANQGPTSLIVGETYYRLGRILRRTGQLDKALKCMKEALPLFVSKAVALADAEMIAEIMHEMALINKDRKNHADAAKIFKQELSVRRKIGQPEFPVIARTLNHLGVAEFEVANHSHSLKFLVEALNIFQRHAKESLDCAEVLFNTGLVFEAVKKNSRALDAFMEAERIFKDHGYNSTHPHLQKATYKIEKLRRKGIVSSKIEESQSSCD